MRNVVRMRQRTQCELGVSEHFGKKIAIEPEFPEGWQLGSVGKEVSDEDEESEHVVHDADTDAHVAV